MQTENKTPQKHLTLEDRNGLYWIREKGHWLEKDQVKNLAKVNYTYTIVKVEDKEKQKTNN